MKILFVVTGKDDKKKFNPSFEDIETLKNDGIECDIKHIINPNKEKSLPQCYNPILRDIRDNHTYDSVVFMHADVDFDMRAVVNHYVSIADRYAIVGLAGAKELDLSISPLTWFTASKNAPLERYGRIINNDGDIVGESFFNRSKPYIEDAEVASVDGLCMFFSKSFLDKDIYFDESFKFDFYDLDICLEALINHKLKIGVMIEPTKHDSVGRSILEEAYLIPEKIFRDKWNV